MKIIQFKATNFMGLEVVEINPVDNTVMITGPNGAGKSAILEGIVTLFCGKTNWPDMPIKEGENTAVLEAKTEEFACKLTIRKEGKSVLEVKSLDGKTKYSSPQRFFDDIRDRFSFDPLKFNQEDPKKQRQILMGLVGLNFSDIQEKYIECQQERAKINSNKTLLQQEYDGIEVPAGTPDEEVSISELAKELQEANTFNTGMLESQRELEGLRNTVNAHNGCVAKMADDIQDMKAEIKELEDTIEITTCQQKREVTARDEIRTKALQLQNSLRVLAAIDTDTITAQIEVAETTNRNVHLKANKTKLEAAIEAKATEYVDLGHQMKQLESTKAERLSKAKMPVEGLSVNGDSVLHDGIPLKQVNTAKALEICIAISMALNPKLRVLWGNANNLDDNSLEIIKKIAEEKDYQLWLEKVDTTGEIGFYIEDGRIVN